MVSPHPTTQRPPHALTLSRTEPKKPILKTSPHSASYDILRQYDLSHPTASTLSSTIADAKPAASSSSSSAATPFLIVPGHRTGVISQLYLDPTCSFMISTGGNRGWEGATTEVLLGYEISYGT